MQESFDFDRDEPAEPTVLSVRDLNQLVKGMLESRVPPVWVEGEISDWKRHSSSGHRYFKLRDGAYQISAMMWEKDARRLPLEPEDGMRVRLFGGVTLYERRGDYQIVAKQIEATGAGGLWRLAFERLRRKLDAEGLLAPERKRTVPRYPRTVGVVTSPVGAAVHDIINVIRRRAPWTHVILSPARVQGDGAARDIARAIRMFERSEVPVDVIIVGRGGGSVEDLWAFNEEIVARTIAHCAVPVISAVGHEVDITIADLVADARAPTPSAAAELAVPDGNALRSEFAAVRHRLARSLRRYAVSRREQIDVSTERLERAMRRAVERRRQRLTWSEEHLALRMRRLLERRRTIVARLAAQVDALSPLQALARGYAVPLDDDGRILRRVRDFEPGDAFRLRVTDGTIHCRTERTDDE